MRHRRGRLRRDRRPRGRPREGRSVLRLPHRGRPAEPRRHPVGVLLGDAVPERVPVVGVRRGASRPAEPAGVAEAHLPGRRTRPRRTRRAAAARDVGHAAIPALGS